MAIAGELTIFAAADLRDHLLEALTNAPEALEVNLEDVSEIDSAGLQLMLAAKREAEMRQKTLRFVGHSTSVRELLQLCDLSARLDLPSPAAADQG